MIVSTQDQQPTRDDEMKCSIGQILAMTIKLILASVAFWVIIISGVLISTEASASELSVRGGVGYIRANVVSSNDWGTTPPAGLIALKYTDDLFKSDKWGYGAELIHLSNVFEGAPFNNNRESNLNYVGVYVEYKFWSK